MILKASQRGGPRQLAAHLLNIADNDHITVQELRGFIAHDLLGAMTEAVAIARGTKCRQPIFSLSVNPPKNGDASLADIMQAIERIETKLGLNDQPRAVVIHEKEGRRHAHAVWSRIDADQMKAINLPFFKTRLKEISKELFLEHEWPLPEGYRTAGWKNPLSFTLAEWQQAKRLDLDPREIKQVFRNAWQHSDGFEGFKAALEERGYYLAKGDRRGIVATDLKGEVYSVARWTGLKTKELRERVGEKEDSLPSLMQVRADLSTKEARQLRQFIVEDRKEKQKALRPLRDNLKDIIGKQRRERAALTKAQEERWNAETKDRASRFRRGLGILVDVLSGRLFRQRKQNEAEAYASFVRDRKQREALFDDQAKERLPIQQEIERMRARHNEERRAMAARMAVVLTRLRRPDRSNVTPERDRDHDLSL
ncbi:relaxase/mobilization nuclease domain-containing protein [Pseudorhodoplanes sp.]|uniref:relaxase/mobilization nuclease domain-containing protein n=1 Tax=Pseudorhodoplanes sp. TaxID=1934341 RepID=UPI003D113619